MGFTRVGGAEILLDGVTIAFSDANGTASVKAPTSGRHSICIEHVDYGNATIEQYDGQVWSAEPYEVHLWPSQPGCHHANLP